MENKNKMNKQMTSKQSIIFIIVIAVSVVVSVFLSMQLVYGQETTQPYCTPYESKLLVVVYLDCKSGVSGFGTIDHYLSLGYHIAGTSELYVYMTK
jgi:hypothetical protein